MIDTIKFRIPLTPHQYKALLNLSCEIKKYDHRSKTLIYNFAMCDAHVGSFDRRITIRIVSSKKADIELSLPKYALGHNVYLIYASQVTHLVKKLHSDLINDGFLFCSPEQWQIVRLDVCYAWKYLDERMAREVLLQVQQLNQPRKKKSIFQGESVMFRGTTYSTKFYLKKPEYYFHDFKVLKKQDIDLAYRMLNNSQGVLRFEVTLRYKALIQYFKKSNLYLSDLNDDKITSILNQMLSKVMRGIQNKATNSEETFNILLSKYSKSKARSLWMFWKLYFDKDFLSKEILQRNYTRQGIYKNLRDLADAGIGLPKETIKKEFDFSIPSDIVVNERAGA